MENKRGSFQFSVLVEEIKMNACVREDEDPDEMREYTVREFFHSHVMFEEHSFSLANEMELKNLSVRIVEESMCDS